MNSPTKETIYYDRDVEVYKLPGDEHMLLIPVASDDNISHELVGPYLTWEIESGTITTRNCIYKPKA